MSQPRERIPITEEPPTPAIPVASLAPAAPTFKEIRHGKHADTAQQFFHEASLNPDHSLVGGTLVLQRLKQNEPAGVEQVWVVTHEGKQVVKSTVEDKKGMPKLRVSRNYRVTDVTFGRKTVTKEVDRWIDTVSYDVFENGKIVDSITEPRSKFADTIRGREKDKDKPALFTHIGRQAGHAEQPVDGTEKLAVGLGNPKKPVQQAITEAMRENGLENLVGLSTTGEAAAGVRTVVTRDFMMQQHTNFSSGYMPVRAVIVRRYKMHEGEEREVSSEMLTVAQLMKTLEARAKAKTPAERNAMDMHFVATPDELATPLDPVAAPAEAGQDPAAAAEALRRQKLGGLMLLTTAGGAAATGEDRQAAWLLAGEGSVTEDGELALTPLVGQRASIEQAKDLLTSPENKAEVDAMKLLIAERGTVETEDAARRLVKKIEQQMRRIGIPFEITDALNVMAELRADTERSLAKGNQPTLGMPEIVDALYQDMPSSRSNEVQIMRYAIGTAVARQAVVYREGKTGEPVKKLDPASGQLVVDKTKEVIGKIPALNPAALRLIQERTQRTIAPILDKYDATNDERPTVEEIIKAGTAIWDSIGLS